jgi:hypothetical protein
VGGGSVIDQGGTVRDERGLLSAADGHAIRDHLRVPQAVADRVEAVQRGVVIQPRPTALTHKPGGASSSAAALVGSTTPWLAATDAGTVRTPTAPRLAPSVTIVPAS